MKFENAYIKILKELYNSEDEWINEKAFKKIKIGKNKFGEIIGFLIKKSLISKRIHKGVWYKADNINGIEFLTNYKKARNQEEFTRMVAFTGSIIALISIHGFFRIFLEENSSGLVWLNTVTVFLLIICLGPLIAFIVDYYTNWITGK